MNTFPIVFCCTRIWDSQSIVCLEMTRNMKGMNGKKERVRKRRICKRVRDGMIK